MGCAVTVLAESFIRLPLQTPSEFGANPNLHGHSNDPGVLRQSEFSKLHVWVPSMHSLRSEKTVTNWHYSQWYIMYKDMMRSWYENAFHITGICEGNLPISCGFSSQRASFAALLFVVFMNKLLNKQSSNQWFKMPWCSCDITSMSYKREFCLLTMS